MKKIVLLVTSVFFIINAFSQDIVLSGESGTEQIEYVVQEQVSNDNVIQDESPPSSDCVT